MANFLLRLSKEDSNAFFSQWIATHPDSRERAETIQALAKNTTITPKPVLPEKQWETMKTALEKLK
jgi:predicted Zn-dependent protease